MALVPDVDACALSPLGVEFKKVVAGAGAPPDRDLGSDAANRHPASPLVASALGYQPKWGPQRETRQTVREGLNDVWEEAVQPPTDYIEI